MIDKLNMQTSNIADDSVEKLGLLFPECITEITDNEGKLKKTIDFEILQEILNDNVINNNGGKSSKECYQFTWPDKSKARAIVNQPINATLRPCREESVNFDTTENLYIEGDNLDVLKLLRETYYGKVKVIYIDPPYNTGNDFVYEDDFSQNAETYKANSGQYDDQGNRLQKNQESNGRFHTDWLNMIYPRLKIARDLLSDDGVIFVSIDDHEQAQLKAIMNELYGMQNFIAQVVWERAYSPINLMKHFSPSHDYILCYAKNIDNAVCNGIPRSAEANDRYANPDNDSRGVWTSSDISVGPAIESNVYPITTPSGRIVTPPEGRSWSMTKKVLLEKVSDNRIWFGSDGNGVPRIKRFLSELKKSGITPMTYWTYSEVGHSQDATQSLMEIFDGKKLFDYPKPVKLIERCLQLYSDSESLVLDFFSGSATTAQAVMQLNAEDSGKRKFIMVQLPEACEVNSEAYKAGYRNICEIGKERIRRAGKRILEEQQNQNGDLFAEKHKNLDVGFRVLKLDSSNMEDVYYHPEELKQKDLGGFAFNIKQDRTDEDLLFQVMLDLGVTLSSKIEIEVIDGKKVFNVNDGYLIACFDENVDEDLITVVANKTPRNFVMRDSSLANDSVAVNFDQIFEKYSSKTARKVL